MRRLSTILAAGVAGLALVAAGPQPAIAAEQELVVVNSVTLLDTGFSDMVKSDRIFLSGGADHDTIQIADLDGVVVGTIPGQAGATGLTLSSDGGTIYAALSRADAISVIDTATGTERGRLELGTGTCPYDVALAGGKLWFSYGCRTTSSGHLGSFDLADPAAPPVLGQGDYLTFAPRLESGSADDPLLFAMVEGVYPNRLISYDVTGATAVRRTAVEELIKSVSEFAVTADGSTVIAATPGPYQFTTKLAAYSTADLAEQGTYGAPGSTISLAVEPDGRIATYSDDRGLAFFSPGQYTPDWVVYRQFGLEPAHRGLAIGAANRLYLATRSYSNSAMNLTTVDAPPDTSPVATDFEFTSPTSGGHVGKPVLFAGTLKTERGEPVGGQTVHVTRTDRRGTVTLPDLTTAADGSFGFRNRPRATGDNTWTFTFDGTDRLLPRTYTVSIPVTR